jgi:hypothetical protein
MGRGGEETAEWRETGATRGGIGLTIGTLLHVGFVALGVKAAVPLGQSGAGVPGTIQRRCEPPWGFWKVADSWCPSARLRHDWLVWEASLLPPWVQQ